MDCFPSLDLANSAVVNMGVQVCLLSIGLGSFGCMPRGGIPVPYGTSIIGFLRNVHTASHNDFSSLHCHHVCKGVPGWVHPGQHLWLS